MITNFYIPTSDQLFNLSSKTKPFVPSLLHTYIVHTFLSNPHLLNTSGERGKRGGTRERGEGEVKEKERREREKKR